MKDQPAFLTAEWSNIIMLNYRVDPATLERFVPSGTTVDEFEGNAWLSLVGFEFKNTRVAGFGIPFHQAFPEVNLRFYVKGPSGRGVVFIRELVPKSAVALVARYAFGENYSRVSMSRRIERGADGDIAAVQFSWGPESDRCSMQVETEEAASLPPDGSLSQFITEHYWGYSAQRGGGCLEYEVQHPGWPVRPASRALVCGNTAGYYGDEFARVLKRTPDSAFLVKGSPVTVFRARRIR